MDIFWVILVLQAFICGGLSSTLAGHKGYSPGAWFAAGFFFGIFGLIAAAGLRTKQVQQSEEGLIKTCPYCAETIKFEAKICRFCGKELPAELIGNGVKTEEISTLVCPRCKAEFKSDVKECPRCRINLK